MNDHPDKKPFPPTLERLDAIKDYLDKHYISETFTLGYMDDPRQRQSNMRPQGRHLERYARPGKMYADLRERDLFTALEKLIGNLDAPFSDMLYRLIDAKGMTEPQVYQAALIDRRSFSRLRDPNNRPRKKTVFALAVALRLSLPETLGFLRTAGFALSHNVMFDVIIEYFIVNGWYDIYDINGALEHFDQELLGTKSRENYDEATKEVW